MSPPPPPPPRRPAREHSLQGLEEVKGESRRWSADGQQALIQTLSVCQGKGRREEGTSY